MSIGETDAAVDEAVREIVAGDGGLGAYGAEAPGRRAQMIERAAAGAGTGSRSPGRSPRFVAAIGAGLAAAIAAAVVIGLAGRGPIGSSPLARAARTEGEDAALLSGREIRIREAGRILEPARGVRLAPAAGSAFSARREGAGRIVVALRAGSIWFEVDPEARGAGLSVETPRGVVAVKGTVFAVGLSSGTMTVKVFRGAVEVRGTAGDVHAVAVGEVLALGPAGFAGEERRAGGEAAPGEKAGERRAGVPSVGELLARVRALRLAGDWRGVEGAYARLVRFHFNTDDARAAMVALGTVRLEKLDDPAGALGAFSSYLSTGSAALAPEALYGKACALGKLGDAAAEREALEAFVSRYPSGPQSAAARRRLAELGAK